MNYGSSGSIADTISRVDSLSRGIAGQSPSAQDFVLYEYIGLSMPAVVDLAWPDVQLDFTAAHNGARTNDQYPGHDRFGRPRKVHWVDGNFTTHATSGGGVVPNIPPIAELNYVYDKASNRLAVLDGRPRPRPPEVRQTNRDHVATHSLESG